LRAQEGRLGWLQRRLRGAGPDDRRIRADLLRRIGDRRVTLLAAPIKAGRTWLRFCLASYLRRVFGLEPPVDLVTYLEYLPDDRLRGSGQIGAFRFFERPEVPLVICAHRLELVLGRKPERAIVLLRNLFDAAVSSYYQLAFQQGKDVGELCQAVVQPEFHALTARLLGQLPGFLAGIPHHVLTYEQMHADAASTLRGVVGWLGLPSDARALAAVVEETRFERMLEAEKRTPLRGRRYDVEDPRMRRIRRGVVGGHWDELGDAERARISALYREALGPEAWALVQRYRLLGT